ncbi:MAG: hypothetical protein IJF67_13425 [Clostridia bacterium]|nr:hypothetical protein [Clostridia bacterium]
MTCNSVYETALALLGEAGDAPGLADYRSRAPHLLGIITRRLAGASVLIDGRAVSALTPSLTDPFPLAERLMPAAAGMLASMLILDELPELAAILAEQAERDRLAAGSELPVPDIGSVREVYGA